MGRKWALVIILSLPLWLVCGVAIGVNYCDAHKPEPYSSKGTSYYQEAEFALKKGELAVQILVAFFTLFLLLVAYWTLRTANKTAAEAIVANNKSLEQTKRSVDAYVGRERGRLVINECQRPDKNSSKIVYSYINAGATELTVMSFGSIPVLHIVGSGFDIPKIPMAVAPSIVVNPEDEFGGIVDDSSFFPGLPGEIPIPNDILMRTYNDPNVRLMAAFQIRYTTAFGRYVKQQVFLLEDHGPMDIMHKNLCYDLPYSEWEEKYGGDIRGGAV